MRIRFTLVSLLVIAAILATLWPAQVISATPPSTAITITRYDVDGTTVLSQVTVNASDLATGQVTIGQQTYTCPIQGDGTTHYFTQGPTFDPDDVWNPAETLNLKDKGALKARISKTFAAW